MKKTAIKAASLYAMRTDGTELLVLATYTVGG